MGKRKLILGAVIGAIAIVLLVLGIMSRPGADSTEKKQEIASVFLADYFKWDASRGQELMKNGEQGYTDRWGAYLTERAIEELLENREPVKYDLLYGTGDNVQVQAVKCEFDDNGNCVFSLDIVIGESGAQESRTGIKGQLLFTEDNRIDTINYEIE